MIVEGKQFLSVWSYRIQAITSAVLQLAIAILVIILLSKGIWLSAFAGAMIFALTFVPAFFERQLSVHLPIEFTLLTTLFLYASFALGEVGDFYTRFWWWDLMLHSLSSLTIGVMGFLAIYVFHMTQSGTDGAHLYCEHDILFNGNYGYALGVVGVYFGLVI